VPYSSIRGLSRGHCLEMAAKGYRHHRERGHGYQPLLLPVRADADSAAVPASPSRIS
jgi:hypothetical protein